MAGLARYVHASNGRLRAAPHNYSRDVIIIREMWYDHHLRIGAILRRFEPYGWTEDKIHDVVYYRSYQSLQPRDVHPSCREEIW